jgi:hypothetical protein
MKTEFSLQSSQNCPKDYILNQLSTTHILKSYLLNIDYNNILPSIPRTFKWSFLYFFYLFNIDYNNILPSIPRPSEWSLSLFLLVTVTHALVVSLSCYVTYIPNSSLFDQPNNIWWRVQFVHLIIKPSLPSSCHIHSGSNILLSILYSIFFRFVFSY